MEKEKKNKKLILLIIAILVLIIGVVGVTYAAFSFTKTGVVSKLVTGDIYMKYTEGSSINLLGAMPSNSYPTKASGNYFQFQIAGKNTSDGSISYTLKLAHGDVPSGKSSSNRIADRWLYFKLVEVTNLGANNESETVLVANGNYTTIPNAVLYTTSIPAGTSSTLTKTYRLYARIDNNLIIGNTNSANYSELQWNSLFASIKLNAEGGYVEPTPVSAGCPGEGCYYSWNQSSWYTTWNTVSRTPKTIDPSNLPSGVSTNYNDVVQDNKFIAMKLNSSNQVEHAYACGIEGGTPFCIEGTYNANPDIATIQQANLDILTPVYGSCSGTVGSNIDCFGSLDARSYSNGRTYVVSSVMTCYVRDDGLFGCVGTAVNDR